MATGQKFEQAIIFMIVDAIQHVSQIGLWIKPSVLCRFDDRHRIGKGPTTGVVSRSVV